MIGLKAGVETASKDSGGGRSPGAPDRCVASGSAGLPLDPVEAASESAIEGTGRRPRAASNRARDPMNRVLLAVSARAVFCFVAVVAAGSLAVRVRAAESAAPQTADQWAAVAQTQLRTGATQAAMASLQQAVSLDPSHGAAGLLITTLHQAGRIDEAYTLGDRYRREGPRNPRALFRFGWILAYTGQIAEAEALGRDLVVLDRGGIYQAWGNGELSYLARARGDPAAAVAFMKEAVAAKPDDVISRVGLAQMMATAGDLAGAVPLLEAELAKSPSARGYGAISAALVLGWVYQQLGQTAAATRWLDTLEAERLTGAWATDPRRELAFLAACGRREEALQLADRTPYLRLYGAPDPRDPMLTSLVGEPRYDALHRRSLDKINAERAQLGWAPLARTK
jgi:tetratricopeptide (TPR) repeat protein